MGLIKKALRSFRKTRTGPHEREVLAELAALDFSKVRERHNGPRPAKYFDLLELRVQRNLMICRELGLVNAPRRRVLDISCGTGLLVYMLRRMGHDAIGVDIDDPFFSDYAAVIGVERGRMPVWAFQPLPIAGTFDAITSIAIEFNKCWKSDHWSSGELLGYWGEKEWSYFLSDVSRLLAPEGQLVLQLNKPLNGGRVQNTALNAALAHAGRKIEENLFVLRRTGVKRAAEMLCSPVAHLPRGPSAWIARALLFLLSR